jgi:hypothetical protein
MVPALAPAALDEPPLEPPDTFMVEEAVMMPSLVMETAPPLPALLVLAA